MARAYKILGQSNPGSNQLTTLYTVPASNSAICSSLTVANLDTGTAGFYISANNSGSPVGNANYLAYLVPIPGRDSISFTLGLTLAAGSTISVKANTACVAFSLFGTEVY
jgi:hypothetical protein